MAAAMTIPPELAALQARIDAGRQKEEPGWPSLEYLQRLATLNTRDIPDVMGFALRFDTAEPVPLCTHAGFEFVLTPDCIPVMTPEDDVSNGDSYVDVSETVISYGATPLNENNYASRPPIDYGIILGRLQYWERPVGNQDRYLEDAGFFVVLNAVDRSVWITVDFFPINQEGERQKIDSADWGRLPGDNQLQIGTMCVSQPTWEKSNPLSITGGVDIFATAQAHPFRLTQHPASQRKFETVLKAAKSDFS